MQRLSTTIPDDLYDQFYNHIPKGSRAQFVADALREALEKHERMDALKAIQEFKPFKVEEDSAEVLRKLRSHRRNYLSNLQK